MEARQSFGRPSVSKTLIAVILLSIAIGLGVMGAYLANGLKGPAATTTQSAPASDHHAVPPRVRPGTLS
jgi:hypothetical protein